MIDPSTALTGAGAILGIAHASKDAVTDIVKRLFGPTADRAGEALADRFFERRAERAANVLQVSVEMLAAVGKEPDVVPKRILMPILENSSWEEEPELQRRWAALLANAASGPDNKIIPAFAEILRQLTPVHAAIIQWMYDEGEEGAAVPMYWRDVSREEIEQRFSLEAATYALLVSDLERLQIIEPRRDLKAPFLGGSTDAEKLVPLIIARWNSREKYNYINFTSLGIHLIQACTPPVAEASSSA